MRQIVIILSILAIVISGEIITQKYLSKSSGELIKDLTSLKNSIENGEEKDNIEEAKEIYEKWEEIRETWSLLAEHKHLDEVDINLLLVKIGIEGNKKNTAIERFR